VKIAPVIREARRRGWVVDIVNTGQHGRLFADTGFELEFPDVTALGTPNLGDPHAFAEAARERLHQWVYDKEPHVVLVQGDVSSAYAGGWFARDSGWPLVHLEAGLRTGDRNVPYPEEMYRKYLDDIADLRLAPTPLAFKALIDEGLEAGSALVGNTVVDALRALDVRYVPVPIRPRMALVTLHRRESWGGPMERIVEGIKAVALETENRHGLIFRWPAHPSPAVQEAATALKTWTRKWKRAGNIWVEEPMIYPRFVRTLAYARAVVTDSGGVVEEAATLGVPCVIARDKTERMEAVHAGVAVLAGRTSEGVAIALRRCLDGSLTQTQRTLSKPSSVFGDGYAAVAACDAMEKAFN